MSDVVNLIRADSVLSSELLRVVNSPIYALRSNVSSVQHAMAMLGYSAAKSIAMAVSMRSFFCKIVDMDLGRRVWRQSLASALIAEELAPGWPLVEREPDRAYTAGLLHDIGRLGLLVCYQNEYSKLLMTPAEGPADVLAQEREAFDIDHCEAGRWLANEWRLPVEVQTAIAQHHTSPRPGGSELSDVVRASVLFCALLGLDAESFRPVSTVEQARELLPQPVRNRLGWDPEAWKARLKKKLDAFD